MRMTIRARLVAGICVVAALVVAMAALSRWTTRTIRRTSTGSTAVLERAVESQRRFQRATAQLEALQRTRAALDQSLRLYAEGLFANRPQVALFPQGTGDPLESFLAGAVAAELAGDADARPALEQLRAAHAALLAAEREIAALWRSRHEGLSQELGELKRTVTTWCLKVANMIFVQSSLVELLYDDLADTPVEAFVAGPVYARHASDYPALRDAIGRVRAANAKLQEAARRLNGLAMSSKWEEVRKAYRDVFPPQLTSIGVDLDGIVASEAQVLHEQERALGVLNGRMRAGSGRAIAALETLEDRLVAGVRGVRGEADAAADQALAGGRGVDQRILALERINLALAALALLVAAAGGLLVLRSITVPLGEVLGGLREIDEGHGDLSRRLPVRTTDEFGLLAGSFNRFAGRLSAMARRIRGAPAEIAGAATGLGATAAAVGGEARLQSAALRSAREHLEGIAGDSAGIAESGGALATAVAESAAATHQVAASSRQIDGQGHILGEATNAVKSSSQEASRSALAVERALDALTAAATAGRVSLANMEAAVRSVAEQARATDASARRAEGDALSGAGAVASVVQGVHQLRQVVHHARETIGDVGERAEQISRLVTVIEEVLDQTHLLALNAAIIAAQAGERDQGFSVVAREMRALADRTAASTEEIVGIVSGLQRAAREAAGTIEAGRSRVDVEVERAEEAAEALARIRQSAAVAREQVATIAAAAVELAREGGRVTATMALVTDGVEAIGDAARGHRTAIETAERATATLSEVAQRVRASSAEQSSATVAVSRQLETVRELASAIGARTVDQDRRTREILAAVGSVTALAEANARRAGSLAAVVAALANQTATLEEEVGRFRLEDEVGTAGPANTEVCEVADGPDGGEVPCGTDPGSPAPAVSLA